MKHTPGPWEATKLSDARYVVTNDEREQHIVETVASYDDVAKANSTLIAAAPEMLEALELVARCFLLATDEQKRMLRFTAMNKINAAIAKAKGGALG